MSDRARREACRTSAMALDRVLRWGVIASSILRCRLHASGPREALTSLRLFPPASEEAGDGIVGRDCWMSTTTGS